MRVLWEETYIRKRKKKKEKKGKRTEKNRRKKKPAAGSGRDDTGRQSKENSFRGAGRRQTVELQVHWHLCGVHKLVALVGGMGGAGCNLPYFLCPWSCDEPYAKHPDRTEEEVALFRTWADPYLQSIHEAANKARVLS
jgi:hypothetical protein